MFSKMMINCYYIQRGTQKVLLPALHITREILKIFPRVCWLWITTVTVAVEDETEFG